MSALALVVGFISQFWLQVLERAPVAPAGQQHVLFEQFWLEKGPFGLPEQGTDGKLTADTVKRRQALLLALFLLLNSCMASFAKSLFARTRCTGKVAGPR